jgi:hypothetical protein
LLGRLHLLKLFGFGLSDAQYIAAEPTYSYSENDNGDILPTGFHHWSLLMVEV